MSPAPSGMEDSGAIPAQRDSITIPDVLAELNDLYRRIAMCKRHPRFRDPAYEKVWLGLCDASDGVHDALDGWPA